MARTTVPSYCRICEASCGILVDVEDGQVVGIRGDRQHPASQGRMCPKGALMARVTRDPERITEPLRGDRKGRFVPVPWDEALDDIAGRVKALIADHGPDSVAYYSGNPAGFSMAGHMWAKKFIEGLGSTGSYSAAPQDTSSRWAASHFLYGNSHETPLPDLDHTDLFLCFGANPLVSHGSLMSSGRIEEQLAQISARSGRVIVVDPARTRTAATYEHVSINPGSDPLLLAAMLNVVFTDGLVSTRAAEQAIGIDALAAAVGPVPPEAVHSRTGVDPDVMRSLARDFATARSACAYGRLGICRGEYPTLANYLLDALNIVTGNLDRRGGVVFGRGLVDFPSINAKVGRNSYGTKGTRVGGLPIVGGRKPWVLADEILTPGDAQVRAVFLVAGNPISSTPDSARLREAFDRLDLLVSVDLYVTESNERADYILPAPTFLERADVLLNFGGGMTRPWTQWTEPVIPRVGDTREETEIFDDLMHRVGIPAGPSPWELIDEMIRSGDRGAAEGWTLERIKQYTHGVELGGDVPVGVIAERIATYTRGERDKVDLGVHPVLAQIDEFSRQQPLHEGHLRLISRRHLQSINSWLHNIRKPRARGGPTLHIHPDDAAERGVHTGDTAILASSVGSAAVTVEVTDTVRPGTVSYPHGWGHSGGWSTAVAQGGININALIPNDIDKKDKLSGMSFLDGVPVTVTAGPV
ncbi:molybdopterin-dependent oxidoreductase [Nocardia vinacea]|uniref:molybdopterin-containing oxidoreductase family protein n=1 Tax=Nocardia vinacea TaxID=96468 RepID=UPI0034398CB1